MAHFAHYVKRTISVSGERSDADLPYTENQPDDQGFERPIYHSIPKSCGAAGRAKAGDTFWLFSQLNTPWGRLSPSLDARIVVKDISVTGQGTSTRIRFDADESSEWFPIFNASTLVASLFARDKLGETQPILSTKAISVGQALRFPREIANAEDLVTHSQIVSSTPIDFVSYRMADGTQTAFELASRLTKSDRAVFWDRWSLPRRMSERGERLAHFALDTHIQQMIVVSRRVWGVQSPTYAADGSYSLLEKELATRLQKFERYPPWNDD